MIVGPQLTSNQVNAYYTNYVSWWSSYGLLNLLRLFLVNLFYTTVSIATISFALLDKMLGKFGIIIIICTIIGLIAILGIFSQLRYNKTLVYYLSGYLCVILLWPWHPSRFLIPILPFLLAYLFREIWRTFLKHFAIANRKLLITLIVSVLIGTNLISGYQIGKMSRTLCYPYPTILKDPVSWLSYSSIFHWIDCNTQPDDIVASGFDTMVYLYTGRRGFRPFAMNPMALFYFQDVPPMTVEKLVHFLNCYKPTYLIQTPIPFFREDKYFPEMIKEMSVKYPGALKTVYVGKDKRFLIFKIQTDLLISGNY